MKMALQKVEKKVSLNIKVSKDLDDRLKRARKAAREKGMIFNVSAEVETFLLKELKKVEKSLSIKEVKKVENSLPTKEVTSEENNQLSLIDQDVPRFTARKVEK